MNKGFEQNLQQTKISREITPPRPEHEKQLFRPVPVHFPQTLS